MIAKKIIAGTLTIASSFLLVACGSKTAAKPTTQDDAKKSLTALTKDVSELYASTKYEMPAVKLSNAKIATATKQYAKTYKLRGDLSKAKKHTLKVAKKRIATAKAMLAVNTEINTALGDKQVIDAKYNDADLQKAVADLKRDAPKFVKSLDASLKTISSEEAAIKRSMPRSYKD
ncbi:hypothetical protein [Lacticaseibacillus sharpeae]|uniref:hypothetical protein n=1 Tax=Lacticaseibacillus sharpeae TaxID=1626 RepID=UPI0006D1D4AE|nr:hypothetical protein [Lacticaseibacillus sharpeae]